MYYAGRLILGIRSSAVAIIMKGRKRLIKYRANRPILLFNRSQGHGSGYTTALSGMHYYIYRVYCLTPATSLCSDNAQNLHISAVERIPRSKVNVLATHQIL